MIMTAVLPLIRTPIKLFEGRCSPARGNLSCLQRLSRPRGVAPVLRRGFLTGKVRGTNKGVLPGKLTNCSETALPLAKAARVHPALQFQAVSASLCSLTRGADIRQLGERATTCPLQCRRGCSPFQVRSWDKRGGGQLRSCAFTTAQRHQLSTYASISRAGQAYGQSAGARCRTGARPWKQREQLILYGITQSLIVLSCRCVTSRASLWSVLQARLGCLLAQTSPSWATRDSGSQLQPTDRATRA